MAAAVMPEPVNHTRAAIKGQKSPVLVFLEWLKTREAPRVIEIGTRRIDPERPTIKRAWAPHASEYTGVDYIEGIDVDVVCDAHALSKKFRRSSVDVVISTSTFEHIERPWIVAEEIGKVLRPGGRVFVQTVFSWPEHGAPYDYWRFTPEGLRVLFHPPLFDVIAAGFDQRATILSDSAPGLHEHVSWLSVSILAEKKK
jgi:SAM-dependent methyltransferase